MKRNKTVDVIISLVCAICLWIYVVTVVTPEDDMTINEIPIVYSGEQEMRTERELVISNKTASAVSVKFHGARADLKRLERYKSDITAVVDTSTFTAQREYSSGYEIILPTALQDQAIQIVDRTPKTVRFTVETLESKTVPVRGVFDGSVANGFFEGALTFDLDSVSVSGPSSVVERVQYAQAILDGTRVSETFSETVNLTLVDENGEAVRSADLSISEPEVTATLEVLTEKEIPLTLSILPGGGASEDNTEITYSRETVLLRGEKSRLDELTELNVGELALGMIEQDTTLTYEITAPEKTQLVSPDDKLDVSVVFRGLDRADFTISSFLSEHADTNAEEGLQARILTQTLRVTLRGPAALLEELQDTDLTAVADLTDYTKPGVFTVPVVIRTPDESVGAVGEYTVELELYVEE